MAHAPGRSTISFFIAIMACAIATLTRKCAKTVLGRTRTTFYVATSTVRIKEKTLATTAQKSLSQ